MLRTFGLLSLSVVLSVGTLWAISALKSLPYSEARGALSDGLSLPGAIIALPFYPTGVHAGRAGWGWTVLIGNWLFYAVVWFVLLQTPRLFRRYRARTKPRNSGKPQ